jgi:hypothetical protein
MASPASRTPGAPIVATTAKESNMSDMYVCIPCWVKQTSDKSLPRLVRIESSAEVCRSLQDTYQSAPNLWSMYPGSLVLVLAVDDILNVSLRAVFGWHAVASKYDLPGSVEQTHMAVRELSIVARLKVYEYQSEHKES